MFFKGIRRLWCMKVQSRSTYLFLAAALVLYAYDRGLLSLIAVILALGVLALDLEES